jgi:vanillate O-demethylase ferredoxin subunit
MIQRLEALKRSWELHYCVRTRDRAAFIEGLTAIEASTPGRIHLNFDHEPDGSILRLRELVVRTSAPTHLYCCGPAPMLKAFEEATADRPPAQVHVEYFSKAEAVAAEGGFTVVLARSGRSIPIHRGSTILAALLENGISVPHSCREGVCGTCETRVLEGEPDHRDLVLTKSEQASNRTMMICCSGSKGAKLVLDL